MSACAAFGRLKREGARLGLVGLEKEGKGKGGGL